MAPTARRVLHVSMPTTEGVAVVLLSYVRDQLARGWSVSLACPGEGWLAARAADAGALVLDWPARRSPGPATLGETRRLGAIVRDVGPDLVHLHSSKAGLAGRLAIRGRIPTVFQPHAWSFLAARGALRVASLGWERQAVRWTGALVLVSAAEQQAGAAHGVQARSWVVPNGVDLRALAPADANERRAARARLGLGAEPLAVCVGRLSEQKGQRDLLDAWPPVRAAVAGATLALIGDGPDRAALEQRALAGVRILGTREDVPDWLAAAHVLLAPSRWDAMALAPLEAMARARCVIATDVAGVAEAVPAGAGDIVAVRSAGALAAAVIRRLTDVAGSDAAGAIGRGHAEVHHNAARSAAELVRIYDSLTSRG